MRKAGVLFLLLSSLVFVNVPTAEARTREPVAAPDLRLPTANGNVSLNELRGKVVLVDFWASWCGPCRESFPWMADMLAKYGSKGLAIVAVNLDKDRELAERFLEKYPAPFVVAFDPAGKTAEAFHVQAMPSSFIVGRNGTVVYAHEGFEPSKAPTVEKKIEEELTQ